MTRSSAGLQYTCAVEKHEMTNPTRLIANMVSVGRFTHAIPAESRSGRMSVWEQDLEQ